MKKSASRCVHEKTWSMFVNELANDRAVGVRVEVDQVGADGWTRSKFCGHIRWCLLCGSLQIDEGSWKKPDAS